MIPALAASRLRTLFDAAIDAARPGPATRAAVTGLTLEPTAQRWVIAVGKAAHGMAEAAVAALAARGLDVAGGIVVAPGRVASPHPALLAVQGDHPVPGILSFAAADALRELAGRVDAGDDVLVLVSGGTSSLLAAPLPGFAHEDVPRLFAMLLASGEDIATVNAVRRRFLAWGAGRLALALAPARQHVLVVSDVPGDDLAVVGSGPCHPDPLTAQDVAALLERAALLGHVPHALREYLDAVHCGREAETPKPGDAAFDGVTHHLVATNRQALEGAARAARAAGLAPRIVDEPLAGEARECGERIARAALALRARQRRERPDRVTCLLWGGESTVTLGGGAVAGRGGRSQELALAAARVLGDAGAAAQGIALLAGGTDGRDGPTDAAGALVGGTTWDTIAREGGDPAGALARHDAFTALARAGALVRTGPTGTNVMDVVIATVGDG